LVYAKHFGLRQEPFSIAPDPRYLYMSERHREALAHLLYGLQGSGGVVLLTGEIGAGKTTVCRCFLEQIPKRCNVAYIFNPKLTVNELLRSVCDEFRIPYPEQATDPASVKHYVDALNQYLLRTHAVGQNNVLIIDEAQNLSVDVLEQLRLLTNLETAERKLLQIILIGQPELRDMLAQPSLEQLAQRVTARYHLEALNEDETISYMRHRLAVAGRSGGMPFTREARDRIHALSRGIPRRINVLCDRAMLGAYAQGVQRIDRPMVDKAAVEVYGTEGAATMTRQAWVRERWPWLAAGAAASILTLAVMMPGLRGASPPAADDPSVVASASGTARGASQGTGASTTSASTTTGTAALQPPPVIAPMSPLRPMRDERRAWRMLALSAQVNLTDGEPCDTAAAQRLVCSKLTNADLTTLKKHKGPAMLTLRGQEGQVGYVIYTGQSDETSLSLRGEGGDISRVDAIALVAQWRGEMAVFAPQAGGTAPAPAPLVGPKANAERTVQANATKPASTPNQR
jgi:general secretion pathway protein A